jgi:hypothetical protein
LGFRSEHYRKRTAEGQGILEIQMDWEDDDLYQNQPYRIKQTLKTIKR